MKMAENLSVEFNKTHITTALSIIEKLKLDYGNLPKLIGKS